MKNDESLRKNVFAEMKKNILERISDSPDQMEQKIQKLIKIIKYGSSGSATNDPELLRLYYWNKIENTFQMLNRDYEFSHQIFAKIALVISRFLAQKFKYGKAIKTPPIGWVNFKIVTCRTANRDQKSMKKFLKRGEIWILKIVVGLFWSHVKSPVVS